MARTKLDRAAIEALVGILDENGLTEVEYEADGVRVRVARSGTPLAATAAPQATAATAPKGESEARSVGGAGGQLVESPMVGTFYAASSPEAPPFVEVGDRVAKGQVVCIIEAMKLMNEIECEYDGVVAERLVENAQGVEFGQPLFRITAG
ncbi:MAG: acetyl-CoA carboxylase biotin carboxyl carrier protein [Bryobacterales bacterium]|nr:acetyl-CoA carboxylase biotin carboxyl carrier protein [Bryobacterales bacterium]MDE0620632.1 acetyl-CoA carboxylase biotin carboxyl carrier protein [Bryobacterales bacterium]